MYIFIFLTVSIASQALQLWVIRFPVKRCCISHRTDTIVSWLKEKKGFAFKEMTEINELRLYNRSHSYLELTDR